MPQSYIYSYSEAGRAEEMIPSMAYSTLLENLGRLTDLGVLESPIAMLVAARIVDRARIVRSGVTVSQLTRTLDVYRQHPKAVYGIVKALEQALERLSPSRLTEP